ncbi:MAG: high-affinity nickel-transport family protein [Polyangiaceae bacterium]
MSWLGALVLGFLLGMRHALDPDHVVAVATFVSRERRVLSALRVGAMWGLGHTATVFLLGGAMIVFGLALSPRLGMSLELSIGAMLVLLGALNVWAVTRGKHEHESPHAVLPRRRRLQPLLVGSMHGLAGSAAIVLLVLATLREPMLQLAYLAVFGVGTLLGMSALTGAMAAPLALASRRFASFGRNLTAITGALSIAFGLFVVYQIGVVDGLFTGELAYNPR